MKKLSIRNFCGKAIPKNIEIEVKFPYTEREEKRIKAICEYKGEKKMKDVYYEDDRNYKMTTQDIWFRQRNDAWECKIDLNLWNKIRCGDSSKARDNDAHGFDNYKELDGEKEITDFFLKCGWIENNRKHDENFRTFLMRNHITPFGEIYSARSKYSFKELNIDLDSTNFGFNIGEIEIMVENEEQIENAQQKIKEFSTLVSVQFQTRINGKVVEYIRRNRPSHYNALITSGLFDRKGINY